MPLPDGLSPDIPASDYAEDPRAVAIADAARRLVELRDRWRNPPKWVERVDKPVPGCPARLAAPDEAVASGLKKRTLSELYNARRRCVRSPRSVRRCSVRLEAENSKDDAMQEFLALNLAER